jgi:dTDP-4-amino-4,6-dideoxygalactose transaminase
MKIKFNVPAYIERSNILLNESLLSGAVSGRGPYTKKCEEWLEKENPSISRALLSTSCTHALEASALLLNFKNDDEIIVPSYTFVTSALAFLLHDANIRFCDIREDTLNIDETLIESLINKNTKAILVVHYAGVACEMDKILEIAKKHDLKIIEDNAHGLFGQYKGRNLGSIGDLSTHSFHETKNISCGEGGALFINDSSLVQRAEIIFEKGTNRSLFKNGQVDKYSWVDKGSSYILSDLLAALLYSQLQTSSDIQLKRESLWAKYYKELSDWASINGVRLPYVPSYCKHTYHMFYMIMPNNETRNKLIQFLKTKDISATFHYLPLDSSEMGAKIRLNNQLDCPVSKEISDCIIRLPLYFDLGFEDQSKVIQAVTDFEF